MQVQTVSILASAPISFIHQTKDGPVHLLVKAANSGWLALYWGSRVAGTWPCATLAQANENVLRCFRNIYFAHQCSNACGPVDALAAHKSDDVWGMIRDF
ncbi:MAG: hypothetical protein LAP39_04745 [Acidobacteriia bacterium]|nr:hypothetical protein [Terriglobia bacterium]